MRWPLQPLLNNGKIKLSSEENITKELRLITRTGCQQQQLTITECQRCAWLCAVQRTGYVICGAQYKMKMQGLCSKKQQELQDGDSRALNQARGLLRTEACVAAEVARPWPAWLCAVHASTGLILTTNPIAVSILQLSKQRLRQVQRLLG